MRTRVKICGFTQPENARAAAWLGVDALGLVFYPPSPRHVDIATAQAIVAVLPPFVSVVGLFVDEQPEVVRETLRQVGISLLQFHGDESADYCRAFERPYLKAVRMAAGTDLRQVAAEFDDAAGLLLDADDAQAKGGTGLSFDWARVPADCPLPIVLAGGLHPGNVRAALNQVRPFAVDVSSGVEITKGVKDADKMAAFIQEVQDFDQHN